MQMKSTQQEGDVALQGEKQRGLVMKSKSCRDEDRYVSPDVPVNLMAICVTVHILLLH